VHALQALLCQCLLSIEEGSELADADKRFLIEFLKTL
jgi:hypothetical protein